jgi:hypothetical protein
VENFKHGNYASGVIGAVATAYQLYGLARLVQGVAQGGNGAGTYSQGQQLDFAAQQYGQQFRFPSIDYNPWHMLTADVLDFAGGLYGTASGIAKGIYEVGTGIATLDSAAIQQGLYDFGSALMPRLGSAGGLNYPGFSDTLSRFFGSDSQPNNASIWHDSAVSQRGFMSSSNQFGWITRAWTGPGIQPGLYGQAYRLLGTTGFGLGGTVQWGLGY